MLNGNIFANIPQDLPTEIIETLLTSRNLRIERIISHGHYSPNDFWYDQNEHEWVLLLQGSGIIEFENDEIKLEPGDHLLINAHCKHRVKWTDPDSETIWLAVFYQDEEANA